ncbi:hypothetical protein Scep_019754 [Stephania cephalantha]|uniref:Uncharacterized protein n=1 Tax=Stephania cephalantha TaxID=152367 RepID=A0AAP0IBH4_9MAGN
MKESREVMIKMLFQKKKSYDQNAIADHNLQSHHLINDHFIISLNKLNCLTP